jgi:methyl-accepting chemotaxis protein
VKFNKWSVKQKLWLSAMLGLVVLGVVQSFNTYTLRGLTAHLRVLGHNQLPSVRAMTLVDMMHDGLRAVIYRSILGKVRNDVKEVKEAKAEYLEFSEKLNNEYLNLKRYTTDHAVINELDASKEAIDRYVRDGSNIILALNDGELDAVYRLLPTYQESFEALETKLAAIGELIEKNAKLSVDESDLAAQRSDRIGLIIAVVGCCIGFLLSTWINLDLSRSLTSNVNVLKEQVHSFNDQFSILTNSSKEISTATNAQAASIQQTAIALEEVGSMVSKTAENSLKLINSSKQTEKVAHKGQSSIDLMLGELSELNDANKKMVMSIEQGNIRFNEIIKVIEQIANKTRLINEIVFQTKLLSFNASVEAARAGEFGRGFAIVADEIAKLAKGSGEASKEISEILTRSINEVTHIIQYNRSEISNNAGVTTTGVNRSIAAADECRKMLRQITEEVHEDGLVSNEISAAIREQELGISEIRRALHDFNLSMKQNSQNSETTSQLSTDLKAQSVGLNLVVCNLELLLDSKGGTEAKQILPFKKPMIAA